jgi:methyl-accepting chemotaxis protein
MNWLENMVLRSKLILLTAVMLIGLLSVSGIALNGVSAWKAQVNELGVVRVPSLVGLMKMRTGINKVIIQQNRARGLMQDPKRIEKWGNAVEMIDKGWAYYKEGFDLYAPLPQTAEEAVEWKKYEENMASYKAASDKFQHELLEPISKGTLQLDDAQIYARMTEFVEGTRDTRNAMLNNIETISKINEDVADATVKEALDKSRQLLRQRRSSVR